MLLKLVDVVGNSAPRLVLAEVVGQINVDGLSHSCDVGGYSALFKLEWPSMLRSCEPLRRSSSSLLLRSRRKLFPSLRRRLRHRLSPPERGIPLHLISAPARTSPAIAPGT